MLRCESISLATIQELYYYKKSDFNLPNFPGHTHDQWGIKAHNRPWIENNGQFKSNIKILEIGGGYSLLNLYLAQKYRLEAWIGDDFGFENGQEMWSRWGDPLELPKKYPEIKYIFEKIGSFSPNYPSGYFDRIFTISTLEHIDEENRFDVVKDINRCLSPGGIQLHTIDIPFYSIKGILRRSLIDKLVGIFPFLFWITKVRENSSEIRRWVELFRASGVRISEPIPNLLQVLDRKTLVESPDVVYRFYPPNNSPKEYSPSASLLIKISSDNKYTRDK
jgi:hypothetical protein